MTIISEVVRETFGYFCELNLDITVYTAKDQTKVLIFPEGSVIRFVSDLTTAAIFVGMPYYGGGRVEGILDPTADVSEAEDSTGIYFCICREDQSGYIRVMDVAKQVIRNTLVEREKRIRKPAFREAVDLVKGVKGAFAEALLRDPIVLKDEY